MEYYDLVLGFIPGSILGVAAVLSVFGIGVSTAIPLGALFAALLIGHALFVRAPVHPDDPQPRPPAISSSD